jgi:hypothetical protein
VDPPVDPPAAAAVPAEGETEGDMLAEGETDGEADGETLAEGEPEGDILAEGEIASPAAAFVSVVKARAMPPIPSITATITPIANQFARVIFLILMVAIRRPLLWSSPLLGQGPTLRMPGATTVV